MDIKYEVLNHRNFLLYSAKFYDNPACHSVDEFNADIGRIKYIKKSFTRYITTGDIKERLVLNHVTILLNVFGPVALARILFLKIEPEYWKFLKPFMVLLNVLPVRIYNIMEKGTVIDTDSIDMDLNIVSKLRMITNAWV